MKPEEFTTHLRNRVQQDLNRHLTFVREAIADNGGFDERKLTRFLEDPGGAAARAGLIEDRDVQRVNKVVFAIYNSRRVSTYMLLGAHEIESDPGLVSTLERLALEPGRVAEREVQEALEHVLTNDTFFTRPIRILLEDDGIRQALEIPDHLTFETYIQRVRQTIAEASTVEEIVRVANLGNPAMLVIPVIALAVVAVLALAVVAAIALAAIAAVAYIAAAVHSYAYAWTRVKTVSAVEGLDTIAGWQSPRALRNSGVMSNCMNETERAIWVVIRSELGLKRIPIPPGKSSAALGLPRVEAILIGGKLNALQSLGMAKDGRQQSGAYILAPNKERPAVVIVRNSSEGAVAFSNDAQMDVEAEGRAGWSDLAGNGSAGPYFDIRFRTSELAATVPENLNLLSMMENSLDVDHFYKVLRLYNLAKVIEGSIRHV